MKVSMAKPEHEIAFQDIVALWSRHADKLDAIDLLAIAANALGKLVALQDQRKFTSEQIMAMVAENIALGNKQVLEQLSQTVGSVQ